MSREDGKAYVYVDDIYAGILEVTDEGYQFLYDQDYLKCNSQKPVSLTLPVSDQIYFSKSMFPFFDGLIPEGYLLTKICNEYRLTHTNRFELLLVSCSNPIGNVSIRGTKDE